MANLKEVRNRITSVTSAQQITKAMKMVSAAKLKRATNAIVQLRPYANKLRDILAQVSASVEGRKINKFSWLEWNATELKGTFLSYPERADIPENIKENLIVELYSK